ncbi:N-acetyltransferase [Lachnospiraceae bacterium ZAX-1]
MNSKLEIQLEQPDDYDEVERLTFDAFETMELPGRTHTDEHYLAHLLRSQTAAIPELDFVGILDGEMVANIMYTRSKIIRPDGGKIETATFGPVSVKPTLHNKGIGTAMIRHSLNEARNLGFGAIVIVGHPTYYPRFGFKPASGFNLAMPDGSILDAFMALELKEDYLGTVGGKWYEDDVFHIDETAFTEWDNHFRQGKHITFNKLAGK